MVYKTCVFRSSHTSEIVFQIHADEKPTFLERLLAVERLTDLLLENIMKRICMKI